MNPLIRRRLPPSVRSLLTDIGPKEEWTDMEPDHEPDTVTRDGILLPSRGASASAQEEFISPANAHEEDEEATVGDHNKIRVCMLCKSKPSCYTCPRCNLHYCGLACYQSPDHAECSEAFYKESVLQELKDMGKTESEGRKKMQEVLLGLRQKAERTDGGMESLLKEAGVLTADTGEEGEGEDAVAEKVQVVELLSRLAELQQSGEDGGDDDETEIEAILRRLEEIGGGGGEMQPEDPDEGTGGGELDLADRLSGLDVDKLSEEELWELLSAEERQMFVAAVEGGAIGELVPTWRPWWEEHEDAGRALVEVLEEEVSKQKEGENSTAIDERDNKVKKKKTPEEVVHSKRGKSKQMKGATGKETTIPPVSAKIPKLSSICGATSPSPLVCYGLVNALLGYTFTLCLYNNDTQTLMVEFCDMVLALSEALNSNRVFNSLQEALDCGETVVLGGGYLDKEDPLSTARALEAVAHIMTGRDRKDATGYCMAGLSQLRSVLSKARTGLSKEGEEGARRHKYFLASKKCEFYQAWVSENAQRLRTLAIELWNEHTKRESLRSSMEKAKTVVEEHLKMEKSKANSRLIEEIK